MVAFNPEQPSKPVNLGKLRAVKIRRIGRRAFAMAKYLGPENGGHDFRVLGIACRAELRARRQYASDTLARVNALQSLTWFA
jgi:hypothetical protein